MISGADNENEAVKLANESQNLIKKAGMELNKWITNSPRLLENSNIPQVKQYPVTII